MVEASEILDRVGKATTDIAGFMLEKRPGDYSFMKVDEFMRCQYARGSRIWTLHNAPVTGCPPEVVVYFGWCWIEEYRSYNHRMIDDSFVALYQGPKIHEPY